MACVHQAIAAKFDQKHVHKRSKKVADTESESLLPIHTAHKITNAVIRGQQSMGDHHVKSRDDLLYVLFHAGHPPVRDHLLHLQEHACVIARQGQTRAQVRVKAAECTKKDSKRECKILHMQAN